MSIRERVARPGTREREGGECVRVHRYTTSKEPGDSCDKGQSTVNYNPPYAPWVLVLLGRASPAAPPAAAGAAPSARPSSSGTAAGSATGVDVPHPIAPSTHWANSHRAGEREGASVHSRVVTSIWHPFNPPGRRRMSMRRRGGGGGGGGVERGRGRGYTGMLCTNRPGLS